MRNWLGFILLVLVAVAAGPASAQQRIALVIGISDYKAGGRLTQTIADAGKVAAALTDVGFSTQTLVKPALSKADLEDALIAFSLKAERADVAVLYFAGHGMQYGDDDWLIPASAELKAESHIRVQGVPLNSVVLELMKPARFRIVILDACRNNPFVVNWGATRSSGDGLARLPEDILPVGSLVAYSASAGQKTPDNGLYADAFAKWIKAEGLELKQVMERVRREMQQKLPTSAPEYVSRYEGAFSFAGGYNPNVVAPSPVNEERVMWRVTQATDSIAAYQLYLKDYPNGPGAATARSRILELQRVAALPAPNASSTARPAPSEPTQKKFMQVCDSQAAGSCPFREVPRGYSAESQMCRDAAAQKGIQMIFRPESFSEDIRACQTSQRALGYY